MVRFGDRSDDGETEPVSVGVAGALVAGLLERSEEPVEFAGRNGRACVADGDCGAPGGGDGGDLDGSTGGVVVQRVVDEVGHE